MNYDELAAAYGAHRRPNPAVLEALVEMSRNHPAPRLLEVGVGTGDFAATLLRMQSSTVTGIDPSIEMLRQVPQPGVTIARARAEALPFQRDQFTMLYSVDVIHHVTDRLAAAHEAFRVLVPGGFVAIVTDSEVDVRNRVPLSTYFPDTVPKEIARYPRIETLECELATAGFAEIDRRQTVTHREITDITPYREKAFSSLHLISDEAHARGMVLMERDIRKGPIPAQQPYTIVVGRKPAVNLVDMPGAKVELLRPSSS